MSQRPIPHRIALVACFPLAALAFATATHACQDGLADFSFGSGGRLVVDVTVGDIPTDVAAAADGGLIVLERNTASDGVRRVALIKRLENGSPDSSFGLNGTVVLPLLGVSQQPAALAVQPDGKIVVVGTERLSSSSLDEDWFGIRLEANGAIDPSFGGGYVDIAFDAGGDNVDTAVDVAIDGSGRVVIAGTVTNATDTDYALARLLSDGSRDASFGSSGLARFDTGGATYDDVAGLALTSQGNILVGGSVSQVSVGALTSPFPPVKLVSTADFAALAVDSTGNPLTSYGPSGNGWSRWGFFPAGVASNDYASGIAVGTDGRAVLVGRVVPVGSINTDFGVLALDPAGQPLAGFGTSGQRIFGFDLGGSLGDEATAVMIQTDDAIIVGGNVRIADTTPAYAMGFVRLLPDGTLDATFGDGGVNVLAFPDDLQAGAGTLWKDRAVLVGATAFIDLASDIAIGRLTAPKLPLFCDGFEPGSVGGWTTHIP